MSNDGVFGKRVARLALFAVAIPTMVVVMLSMTATHRFLTTSAVLPLLLVAIMAEQINRRGFPRKQLRRVLTIVQVCSFLLSGSLLITAGILRQ
jgi:hypothetical protein